MKLNVNDWIGFIGVAILLVAFLMNLLNKLNKDSLGYIVLNIVGAGLACVASLLIHYLPFVILEGTWAVVSAIALIKQVRKN